MKEKGLRLLYVVALIIGMVLPTQAAVTLEGDFRQQVTVRRDLVLTIGKTGGEIGLWDLSRSRNGRLERPTDSIRSGLDTLETLQVSCDGRYFSVTGIFEDRRDGKVAAIRIYASNGRPQHSLTADRASDPSALIAFSTSSAWAAFYVGGELGKIDLRTGRQVTYRRDHHVVVEAISIDPDGETVSVLCKGVSTSYSERDEERDSRRRD